MSSVNKKKALINKLLGEIHQEEKRILIQNSIKLESEVRNLLGGVGEGYCYSPDLYLSNIKGVKYIVVANDCVIVKITSPRGRLLPEEIMGYPVVIQESDNYSKECDY